VGRVYEHVCCVSRAAGQAAGEEDHIDSIAVPTNGNAFTDRMRRTVTAPIWIVADDLTGAADAALPFWRAGHRARVVLDPAAPWPENPGVLSLCTYSRAMSETAAAAALRALAARLPRDGFVFKKIDSTLRGWIGAECVALLDEGPQRAAIFAPAYPSKGRTLGPDGVYRVHGVPLAETEFAPEITSLAADSTLPAFIAHHFGAHAPLVRVLAAQTDAELRAATASIDPSALWIGSPGLAVALAGPAVRPLLPSPPPMRERALAIVIAVGSRRAVAQRQVEALVAALSPGPLLLRPPDIPYDPVRAARIADDLGARAAEAACARGCGGLILTGGDTAAATCRHLGLASAEIVGEVEDGLPVLRAGEFHLVTKAGGFGDDRSLVRAHARLASFLV